MIHTLADNVPIFHRAVHLSLLNMSKLHHVRFCHTFTCVNIQNSCSICEDVAALPVGYKYFMVAPIDPPQGFIVPASQF